MRVAGIVRRAGWSLIDQVISSATNAVLSVLVARSVDDTSFGGFTVAFTVFTLAIGVSRAISTSPLTIRFSDASPSENTYASGSAVGSALVLGAVAGAGCMIVGGSLDGAVGQALFALGVVFPALTVQDAWRYVFFARGRPAAAALNDAVWAVVQLAAVTGLLVAGMSAVGPLVLAWGGAAAAAAVLGVHQAGAWPAPLRTRRWLRDHRNLTGYLLAEFGTLQGCNQGTLLVIAAVGSLEALGALRGAHILLAPTTILATAAFSFAVPEFARRKASLTGRQWTRGALGLSAFVAGLGFCWGLVFLLIPGSVGFALLGATWPGTSEILVAVIVSQVGAALAVGPAAMIYAMDRAPVTLAIHGVLGPIAFVGGVGGVLLAGAPGAAWGIGIAFWAVLPLWLYRLRRETMRLEAELDPNQSGIRA